MNIVGTELVNDYLRKPGYFFKAIINDSGVAFFSGKTEHRTVKTFGLSYEDNYEGNAMAAIITGGRIEIRNHNAFSTDHVATIMKELLSDPSLRELGGFEVSYKGEKIRTK